MRAAGTRTYPSGLHWAQEAFGLEGAFVPNLTPAAPQISAECSRTEWQLICKKGLDFGCKQSVSISNGCGRFWCHIWESRPAGDAATVGLRW
jgi:hypothetical protein